MKALREIDLSSFSTAFPYSVRFGAFRQLEKSIRASGLYQPLTAVRKGKRYLIVSGKRRFLAARKLGIRSLPCFISEEKDPRELFALNVRNDLETSSPHTPVEKAAAFEKALALGTDISGMRRLFRLLQIPFSNESKRVLERILKCPRDVREWLHEKDAPFTFLGFLTQISPEDLRDAVVRLFRPMGTGANETTLIAAALRDISAVQKVSVPSVVSALLKGIGPSSTKKEALERLRRRITAMRYPIHSEIVESFSKMKEELSLPAFCRLDYGHPSAPESLLLQARISGLRDAERFLAWIGDSRNHKTLLSFLKSLDPRP